VTEPTYLDADSQIAGLELLRSLAPPVSVPTQTGASDVRSGKPPGSGYKLRSGDERGYPDSYLGNRRRRSRGSRRSRNIQAGHGKAAQTIRLLTVATVVIILGATAVIATTLSTNGVLAFYWIISAAGIALCLVAFLNERKFVNFPIARGNTLAIIPAYNEPAEKLYACVRSLLAQTVEIDQIVVVDDGSAEPVKPFYAPNLEWVRQSNRGKRGAHVTALRLFDRDSVHFVLTVDSDSTPYPDALEHMLRAMSRSKVQAVTGWLHVRNYDESLVARVADINIGGSCVMMRASRSMLGALETTSGALSLYRSDVLYDNLDDYELECGTGDDRWLTMRALLRGEVIGVNQARVETDMPPTLRGTFRQRLRWARSWWWMLPFAYARLGWRPLISPTVGLIQLLAAPMILLWAVLSFAIDFKGQVAHPWTSLIFIGAYICVKYAISALYLLGRPNMPRRQKLLSLIIGTPLAMLLSLLMLMPIRFYALTRLHDTRWQTRQVKVSKS
jgi:cellulose synthase/poly-beta-1,6-N-acetylglucosamine synthase-like glycosyltransferase